RASLIEDWWQTRPDDLRVGTCESVAVQGIETVVRGLLDPVEEDLGGALPIEPLGADVTALLTDVCPAG
ncbi:MAG: hypothetical protein HZB15_18495, partial [Actinobacteria bacterium]|nr:hypothetical protein [Actinomycetota bacterium]